MKKQLILIFCAVFATCSMQTPKAAIITVTNLNNAGTGSLRWAIGLAASGDTINFSVTGTIYYAAYSEIGWNKDLTILGPGPSQLILDGRDSSYLFHLNGGRNLISGIAFINGNNTAINAGCIYMASGSSLDTTILENCSFRKSRSSGAGGAINGLNGRPLVMRHCIIDSCTSANGGGGIRTYHGAIIENTTFSNCSSVGQGGAVWIVNEFQSIVNCTFSNNHSNYYGGAVVLDRATQALLINNTFSGNSAASSGDAISSTNPLGPNMQLMLQNNILISPVSNYSVIIGSVVTMSNGGNISGDSSMIAYLTATNDMNNTDPLLDTSGLQQNGGGVPTIALTAGSPAIDNGTTMNAPALDQRGYGRSGLPDAGAYEYNGVVPAGIPELIPGNLVSIYPNPAEDHLIIWTEKNIKGNIEFALFNILGEKVICRQVETSVVTLDVSSLSPAIYFYTISESGLINQSGKICIK